MDMEPRRHDKELIWACKDCNCRNSEAIQVQPRKSERIREVVEIKLNRITIRKHSNSKRGHSYARTERVLQAKQLIGEATCLQPETKMQSTSSQSLGKDERRKRKRKLVLNDDENSYSEGECESESAEGSVVDPLQQALPGVPAPSPTVPHSSPFSESDEYVCAQPIINPIWKGCFNIRNEKKSTSAELLAHLSTKACLKAWNAANILPQLLHIDILSKSDAWPPMFQITPPTDEHIALYFFPGHERNERAFDSLIDEIILHDYALKAVINNLELLIFSSRELPLEYWRFRRKYYLWGVFKPTNTLVNGSNAKSAMFSNLTKDVPTQLRSGIRKTDNVESSPSPSNSSSCVTDSGDPPPQAYYNSTLLISPNKLS